MTSSPTARASIRGSLQGLVGAANVAVADRRDVDGRRRARVHQPRGRRDHLDQRPLRPVPRPARRPRAARCCNASDAAPAPGSLLFTIGCHAGLSSIDAYGVAGDPGLGDWSAQLTKGGSVFVGNTGFGYGDTGSVAYSERLLAGFAEPARDARVDRGPGAHVRQAAVLRDARRRGRLRRQGAAGGDVLRAADVSRLRDRRPRRARAAAARPERRDDRLARERRPPSGVHARSRPIAAATGPPTAATRSPATSGRSSRARISTSTPTDGAVVHGALITALASTDVTDVNPVLSRPTVDLAAHEPETGPDDVAFPATLQRVQDYAAAGRPSRAPEPRRGPVRRRPGRSGGARDPAALHAHRRRRAALALDGLRPAADHACRDRHRRRQGDVRRHDARQRRHERRRAVPGRRGRVAQPGPDGLGRARARLRAAAGGRRRRPAWRSSSSSTRPATSASRPTRAAATPSRRSRRPAPTRPRCVADPPPGPDGMSQPPVSVDITGDARATASISVDGSGYVPYSGPIVLTTPGVHVVTARAPDGSTSRQTVIIADQVPVPTLASTSPVSPSTDDHPRVSGTAPGAAKVLLYAGSDCSGPPIGEGSAADFEGAGIPVTVARNATTTLRAVAVGVLGSRTACSSERVDVRQRRRTTRHAREPAAARAPARHDVHRHRDGQSLRRRPRRGRDRLAAVRVADARRAAHLRRLQALV